MEEFVHLAFYSHLHYELFGCCCVVRMICIVVVTILLFIFTTNIYKDYSHPFLVYFMWFCTLLYKYFRVSDDMSWKKDFKALFV